MSAYICTNPDCAQRDVPKTAVREYVDEEVICGECLALCTYDETEQT